ncbi:SDR family oxidoreductase, partial [Lentilactobacillus kefiri]
YKKSPNHQVIRTPIFCSPITVDEEPFIMCLKKDRAIFKGGFILKYTLLGSLGNIGRVVVPALVNAGNDVTVISSNSKRSEQIREVGAQPAIGNMADSKFLANQFEGADAVYLMVATRPSDSIFEDTEKQGRVFAEAIKRSGVKNVVDLSSIGANNPQAGVLYAYHWIEDQLKELEDVNVAFIRPVGFYSNLYANINTIRADHAIYSNIPETITQRWAAPQDIAAVVLKLLQHVPVGTSVHYVYSDAFSTQKFIETLQDTLSMPDLHFVSISDEQAEQSMVDRGVSKKLAQLFIKMSELERHPEKLYADLDNQTTNIGEVKLADFVKAFSVAYQDQNNGPHANTLVDQ